MSGDMIFCECWREGPPPRCELAQRTTGCLGGICGCVDPAGRERRHQERRAANSTAEREARVRATNAREWHRKEMARLEIAFAGRGRG
jgi:hypothetical protein